MRVLELFCCSGGMAQGLREAGLEVTLAYDADHNACDSYERNLGHRPVQMDVRDLLRMLEAGWSPGPVGLLVADPPCTPWSRAGKREGLDDERDMLRTTVAIIEVMRPRAWLIGNVPGLDDNANWDGVVQPIIGGMAVRNGYCVDYAKFNAADFGVPQRRVRPFWFGHPRGSACIRWPAPTNAEPPLLPGCGRKPWVTCREALAHLPAEELGRPVRVRNKPSMHPCSDADGPSNTIPACQPGNGGAVLLLNEKHPPSNLDSPAMTICAKDRGGAQGGNSILLDERIPDPNRPAQPADQPARTVTRGAEYQVALEWPWDRPATTVCAGDTIGPPCRNGRDGSSQRGNPNAIVLSERAAAVLQGFPDGWTFAGKTKRARWSQIGQAMPPPLARAVAGSIKQWFAGAESEAAE